MFYRVSFCFFFQAEDGIRDVAVTGVQTCALPISRPQGPPRARPARDLGLHQSLHALRAPPGFPRRLREASGGARSESHRAIRKRGGSEARSRFAHENPRRVAILRSGAGRRVAASVCARRERDRKSTRLNSSHGYISYAVFCLKKKNK